MISFPIEIQDGKIVKFDRRSFSSRIKFLRQGKFYLKIDPNRPTRSNQQNAYLWGVVYDIIGKDTGYAPDEVHQIMTEKFLSYEKNGRMFVKSTTKLNTVEMEEYLERIRKFASMDLTIFIPLPNEPTA